VRVRVEMEVRGTTGFGSVLTCVGAVIVFVFVITEVTCVAVFGAPGGGLLVVVEGMLTRNFA
jgi:hypothetical protein